MTFDNINMYCTGSGGSPLFTAYGIDCTASPEQVFSTDGIAKTVCRSGTLGSSGIYRGGICLYLDADGTRMSAAGALGTFQGMQVTSIVYAGASPDSVLTFSGSMNMHCAMNAGGLSPYLTVYGVDCTPTPETVWSIDGTAKEVCYSGTVGSGSTIAVSNCLSLPASGAAVGTGSVSGAQYGLVVSTIKVVAFTGSADMHCSGNTGGLVPYLSAYGIDCSVSPEQAWSTDGRAKTLCYSATIGSLGYNGVVNCLNLPANGNGISTGGVAGAQYGFVVTSIKYA